MRALILSAGLGERLRPLTLKRAKPALEFLNVPMLAFPYHWLSTLGLREVAFNTHYLPETIRHAAMDSVDPSLQLHFPFEDHILGSGGGIWNSRFHLMDDEVFAVANGDGVVTFEDRATLTSMLRAHRDSRAFATMLVCPLDGVGTRIPGVWVTGPGTGGIFEVVNFGKASDVSHDGSTQLRCLHYASVMLISKRVWEYLPSGPSNILYDVFKDAMAEGEKVMAFCVDSMRWYETGNIPEYLAATGSCLESVRLGDGHGQGILEILQSPYAPSFEQRSDLSKRLLIADSATLEPDVELNGFVVIGPDVTVEAGARIENSVLLPGARVTKGEVLFGVMR